MLARAAAAQTAAAASALLPPLPQLPSPQELFEVASEFIAVFGTALSDAPAQIQLAVEQISAGQITSALNTIVNIVLTPVTGPVLDAIFSGTGPLVDLVGLLQRPFAGVPPISNVIGLLGDPDFLLTVGLGPLQSIYALTSAVGGAAEAMLDAAEAGNPGAFVSSLVKGIGDVTEAVIDRLLNPGTPPYGYDRGLIAGLIEAGKMIFAALTAPATAALPATAAITASTTEAAATFTLSTTPEIEAEPVAGPDSAPPVSDLAGAAEEEAEQSEVVTDETEQVEVVTDESEESLEPTDEEAGEEESDVRTGIVAVPGEVAVGVAGDDETPTGAVTQPVSTTDDDQAGAATPSAGTDPDTADGDGDGAGDGDGGDGDNE
ncbi:hypothetical protein [Mycobacterium deserti]|uniref:PE-PGRS family protein n=1 Tax=Mycobacterium deserti TaxID=2978347 RepID=A0ABT2M8L4_9MYCO|nr:hypothetical protein [Mycobacterium deserti]MCT7658613.1 hypothetical protein [Mycobacterium deserti]